MNKIKLPVVMHPLNDDIVRLKKAGNITEIMCAEKTNTQCPILRVNKDNYVDKRTGEVKNFNHIESRAEDKNSVRVSLTKLRDIINANITNPDYCRWVTLTYAENMTDDKRLYSDFKKFIMRMRSRNYIFEYIVAMEPQGRGAWHAHLLMIFDKKAPFIPNNQLEEIWGHGFVKIKALSDIDNIGVYLTAYLGDMELDEAIKNGLSVDKSSVKEVEVLDESGKKIAKSIVKGARLSLYPPKFHIFRKSRGIKLPDISYTSYSEAKNSVGDATPTFEQSVIITDPQTGFNNQIYTGYFNTNRINSQS